MSGRVIRGGKSGIKIDTRGLGEFYFYAAEEYGNKICQIDAVTGKQESYKNVKERSTRLAIHMRKLGLTSEDFIISCIKNTLDNAIPTLSALYLGAKTASLDGSQSVRECAHCMSIVRPKYVFVEAESVQLMEDSIEEAQLDSTIIVIGESKKYKTFSELLEPVEEEKSFKSVTVNDCHETAMVYFSSGTTGMPKGTCVTHFGLLNNCKAALSTGFIDTNIILYVSPLCYISAALLITIAYLTGGCRVLISKFEAEEVFLVIEKYKVTSAFLAPIYTYYLTGVKDAEKFDTTSIKTMILGGTPRNSSQLNTTRELFKHSLVTVVYGTTESTEFVTAFRYTSDSHLTDRYESSGRCVNDAEIKIVDVKTREILGPNQKGEICIRSPYISPCYYNNPTSICDEEGFIQSGDIGYYNEDEYLYIIDRINEMFTYRSWYVMPSFLEAILQEHPCVKEAAVFGIPHDVDEFWPAACVVLKNGAETTEEDINYFFSPKVSRCHQLRGGIKIVKSIPKSPGGKLQRWKLRQYFINN